MKFFVMGLGVSMVGAVGVAVRYHFTTEKRSIPFDVMFALSIINVVIFASDLWEKDKPLWQLALALLLLVLAAPLFSVSLRASRAARLKLIFDKDDPSFVLKRGPYRYIRHPFYTSYILMWAGLAVATLNPLNIAYAVLIIPVFAYAAKSEEAYFASSARAANYTEYRKQAGMFWPKLW